MAKRRGNPNWGKPEPIGPVVPTVTSFEQVVKEFKLTPDQYVRSTRLREWARRNKNSKYIPEALLEAWGFEINPPCKTKRDPQRRENAAQRGVFCVWNPSGGQYSYAVENAVYRCARGA